MRAGQGEQCGRLLELALDVDRDVGVGFQFVPHQVDLVQHRDAARRRRLHVLLPHVEVGLGDAGIHREQKQHGVRIRDHRERQLGFGAERVQPRRVEHDQPAFEQRMRVADHGVAPRRNFHLAAILLGGDHRIVVVPQAERPRLFDADLLDFDEMLHRLGHFLARLDVEFDLDPFDVLAL